MLIMAIFSYWSQHLTMYFSRQWLSSFSSKFFMKTLLKRCFFVDPTRRLLQIASKSNWIEFDLTVEEARQILRALGEAAN